MLLSNFIKKSAQCCAIMFATVFGERDTFWRTRKTTAKNKQNHLQKATRRKMQTSSCNIVSCCLNLFSVFGDCFIQQNNCKKLARAVTQTQLCA
jgi:hypothetical protein